MAVPLREARRQQTRALLLEAAEEVLAQRGLSEARVEEIAERAGVAVGTIYNYFADRDALVHELLAVRRGELEARLAAVAKEAHGRDFRRALESFAEAVFAHFDAHRPYLQVALEIEHQRSMSALRSGRPAPTSLRLVYEAAGKLVRSGVETGAIRPGEMWAAFLTGSLRAALIQDLHQDSRRPAAESARLVAEFFLAGARA